jgi:hypothetical protein
MTEDISLQDHNAKVEAISAADSLLEALESFPAS